MSSERIPTDKLLACLPAEWPADLRPEIRQQVRASGRKVIVLDDDPTGTQTVHGIPVLTEWPVRTLRAELANDSPVFYILTNSRSLPLAEAQAMNAQIGRNLVEAARQADRNFVMVSRSDSTLRGHFPGEVEALAAATGQTLDGWLIIPFFQEGGRYTVNDIHYVDESGWLVPAGETPFAQDSAFGYTASNLCQWVVEKTQGRIPAEDVLSISIEDLRQGGPEQVTKRLMGLTDGKVCIVNAASYRDMEVLVRGLLAAEGQGRRFLYRTAASFVQVRSGLSPLPLLTRDDMDMPESGGGLIVVGSYVPRTTSQIQVLLRVPGVASAEISVPALLDDARRQHEIVRVAQLAEKALLKDRDVVLYTSRGLVTVDSAERSLSIGNRVSEGLISILQRIATRPRYLIGKGGITSSDVATKALNVKRALVLGQILPGVPVWQLGPDSRDPGMPYVVFPGNVGSPDALAKVVTSLRAA